MSDASPPASGKSTIDWGAVTHAVAGLSAVIVGALMYFKPWARDLFSILMVVACYCRHLFFLEAFSLGAGALVCHVAGRLAWCWVTSAGSGVFPLPTSRCGSLLFILLFADCKAYGPHKFGGNMMVTGQLGCADFLGETCDE
jgi:hypothetical protein